MKRTTAISLVSAMIIGVSSCHDHILLVSTDASIVESDMPSVEKMLPANSAAADDSEILAITIDTGNTRQTFDGFGTAFSEMDWDAMNLLTPEEKEAIFEDLFAPGAGMNFIKNRVPTGASDYARGWYSYDEFDGDFEMEHFSIANDYTSLIPYMKKALSLNPEMTFWSSPWCPPSWMKYNKHYAMKVYDPADSHTRFPNGLKPEQAGHEGNDMFIQEPEYLQALALYFKKYVEAYRAEGIKISAILPQNEFNSDQIFPSCCWKAESLANFIANYFVPTMAGLDVDVYFTTERPDPALVETVLDDPAAGRLIDAVGFQWAGAGAIKAVAEKYPDMKLFMSEHECGDGNNDWWGAMHSWDLLRFYMNAGVTFYDYWNVCTLDGGVSRWNWPENSLLSVNPHDCTYRHNWDYYVIRHASHYILPGAKYISQNEDDPRTVAFLNPDGKVVILYMEKEGKARNLAIDLDGKAYSIAIEPLTINTVVL